MRLSCRCFLFCVILLVWAGGPVRAQKRALQEADALFNSFQYPLALTAYQKLLDEKQPTLYLTERIAACYRQLNNAKAAERWYQRVILFPEADPTAWRYAADAARENGNYEQARQLYQQYGQRLPDQAAQANLLAASCDSARQWLAAPEPYELQKPVRINSENSDFSPFIYQNGLVFTSDRPVGRKKSVSGWTGKPYPKIYLALPDSTGQLSAPVAFGRIINNKYQNGSAAFTPNGQTMYFTRINQAKSPAQKSSTDPLSWLNFEAPATYVHRLEIFISRKQGEAWGEPKPFAHNKVSAYSVGHPAIAPDGETLYFVSDMPGGLGETDIYFCARQADGTWAAPVNAGDQINTTGKELFPVIAATGKLYFSSEGHPGLGGMDIFAAEGQGATWRNVQNLKAPLNSPADDFGITFDETKEAGFLSSNRDSPDGTDNIYAFKRVRLACELAGRITEQLPGPQGEPLETPVAQVLLRLTVAGDTTAVETYSDAQGYFTFPTKAGLTYTLQASKDGYLIKSTDLTADCQPEVDMAKMGITLNRNSLNNIIKLENIYYDFDKYDIRPEAIPELDKLARILAENPAVRIEIGSHTDSRQSVGYNERLSQLRAEAVVNYLISRGIAADRLVAKGYGETQLLNGCRDGVTCSELEHQINRRTIVRILSR